MNEAQWDAGDTCDLQYTQLDHEALIVLKNIESILLGYIILYVSHWCDTSLHYCQFCFC